MSRSWRVVGTRVAYALTATYCYPAGRLPPPSLLHHHYLVHTYCRLTLLPHCQVRNLADAIVVYEQQYKLRYDKKQLPALQILADARHVLSVVKDKVSSEW